MILFPTQEIGSIDKIGAWRRKGVTEHAQLEPQDWSELEAQRELYGVDGGELPHDLEGILRKPSRTREDAQHVKEWSALFALRMFEKAGLDIVYSGEQFRSEMYQQPANNISGFEPVDWVRSWDNKYWIKYRAVAEPRLKKPFHLDEFQFTRDHAGPGKVIKVPITGAYTLADWSFNEYFAERLGRDGAPGHLVDHLAKRALAIALAQNVVRPHIEALVHAGAGYVQIDEPAAATKPQEVDIVVDSYNESVKGLGNTKFGLHICFTNYDALFPEVRRLENCGIFTWEFANRDDSFASYDHILGLIKQHTPDKEVGLGVLHVHVDDIESPQLVRDRILRSVDVYGDPTKIYVNPDCGLRTRSLDITYRKLANMAEGANLARQRIEG